MIKAKRFWSRAYICEDKKEYFVKLDERILKTPSGAKLTLPTRKLAELLVTEWSDIEGEIDANQMPFTRLANSAFERMEENRDGVVDHILDYLDGDVTLYRAEYPSDLVEAQLAWDEWIKKFEDDAGRLQTTKGLNYIEQDDAVKQFVKKWCLSLNNFELMAMQELVSGLGSVVISYGVAKFGLSSQNAYRLSIIDELYQEQKWGEDEEALLRRDAKEKYLHQVESFFHASDFELS